VLSKLSYGGIMAETVGGFATCHHSKAVANRVSRGGPWRPLFV